MDPNDNIDFCQCDDCTALDVPGQMYHGVPSVTDRVVTDFGAIKTELVVRLVRRPYVGDSELFICCRILDSSSEERAQGRAETGLDR